MMEAAFSTSVNSNAGNLPFADALGFTENGMDGIFQSTAPSGFFSGFGNLLNDVSDIVGGITDAIGDAADAVAGEAIDGVASGLNGATKAWVEANYPETDTLELRKTFDKSNITAEDSTEFGKRFETITDMKVSQSISLYKAETGSDLSPETVKRLFSDKDFARDALIQDKNLHTVYRDILNTNAPATEAEAQERGFTKLSFGKSLYHNPMDNNKYVSPDGHLEMVYNKDTGARVDSVEYKGTFNFFGPDNTSEHIHADVYPYAVWGN